MKYRNLSPSPAQTSNSEFQTPDGDAEQPARSNFAQLPWLSRGRGVARKLRCRHGLCSSARPRKPGSLERDAGVVFFSNDPVRLAGCRLQEAGTWTIRVALHPSSAWPHCCADVMGEKRETSRMSGKPAQGQTWRLSSRVSRHPLERPDDPAHRRDPPAREGDLPALFCQPAVSVFVVPTSQRGQ